MTITDLGLKLSRCAVWLSYHGSRNHEKCIFIIRQIVLSLAKNNI